MRVRDATADDASACVLIYTPYVRDTAITFETEVPTVEEMARRITADAGVARVAGPRRRR
jgi:L-amino acid N-acyltransferase YncA